MIVPRLIVIWALNKNKTKVLWGNYAITWNWCNFSSLFFSFSPSLDSIKFLLWLIQIIHITCFFYFFISVSVFAVECGGKFNPKRHFLLLLFHFYYVNYRKKKKLQGGTFGVWMEFDFKKFEGFLWDSFLINICWFLKS